MRLALCCRGATPSMDRALLGTGGIRSVVWLSWMSLSLLGGLRNAFCFDWPRVWCLGRNGVCWAWQWLAEVSLLGAKLKPSRGDMRCYSLTSVDQNTSYCHGDADSQCNCSQAHHATIIK